MCRFQLAQTLAVGKNVRPAGWSLGAGYSVIVATQPEFTSPASRILASRD